MDKSNLSKGGSAY